MIPLGTDFIFWVCDGRTKQQKTAHYPQAGHLQNIEDLGMDDSWDFSAFRFSIRQLDHRPYKFLNWHKPTGKK
jgi:hypothetical protein